MKCRMRVILPACLLLLSLPVLDASPSRAADGRLGDVHLFFHRQWYEQHRMQGGTLAPGAASTDAAGSGAAGFSSFATALASNVTYHNGDVMQTVTVYAIYWGPGTHAIPSSYQELIDSFFADVSGSSFYNILTQYYEGSPHSYIRNIAAFGGSWADTANPYPHAGTGADPLGDADIRGEVRRAIDANGWPNGGLDVAFFVFTAKGIESCVGSSCTIGTAHPVYCAYHWAFSGPSEPIIYANMPYNGTWSSGFRYSCGNLNPSPNDDPDADEEISTASHELFEAVSDPLGGGWYDSDGDEIGDKCAYVYGTVAADGSNVTLNGHPYIVQKEWSNAVSHCALKYGSSSASPTPSPTTTRTPTPAPAAPESTATPTRPSIPSPTASRRPTATATRKRATPTPTSRRIRFGRGALAWGLFP